MTDRIHVTGARKHGASITPMTAPGTLASPDADGPLPSPPTLRLVGSADEARADVLGSGGARGEVTQDWTRFASCRGMEVDIFFATEDEDIEAAKLICRGCAVQLACLAEAIRNPGVRGVWGGASEHDRASARWIR